MRNNHFNREVKISMIPLDHTVHKEKHSMERRGEHSFLVFMINLHISVEGTHHIVY